MLLNTLYVHQHLIPDPKKKKKNKDDKNDKNDKNQHIHRHHHHHHHVPPFKFPGLKDCSLKGFSFGSEKTGFIIPEFNLFLDSGIQSRIDPKIMFITHQHTDHTFALPMLLTAIKTKPIIFAPKSIISILQNFFLSTTFLDPKKIEHYDILNNPEFEMQKMNELFWKDRDSVFNTLNLPNFKKTQNKDKEDKEEKNEEIEKIEKIEGEKIEGEKIEKSEGEKIEKNEGNEEDKLILFDIDEINSCLSDNNNNNNNNKKKKTKNSKKDKIKYNYISDFQQSLQEYKNKNKTQLQNIDKKPLIDWMLWVGIDDYSKFRMRIKNTLSEIEVFELNHYPCKQSFGYGFSVIKNKLKPEYKNLKGKDFKELLSKNPKIKLTNEKIDKNFAYVTDTCIKGVKVNEDVIFKYKTVIIECTFIDQLEFEKKKKLPSKKKDKNKDKDKGGKGKGKVGKGGKGGKEEKEKKEKEIELKIESPEDKKLMKEILKKKSKKHIFYSQLEPYFEKFKDTTFILIHFSFSYSKKKLLNFFETQKEKYPNLHPWISFEEYNHRVENFNCPNQN